MLLALTLAGGVEGAANYIRLVYLDFAKKKKKNRSVDDGVSW